jgi:hypothetical protein
VYLLRGACACGVPAALRVPPLRAQAAQRLPPGCAATHSAMQALHTQLATWSRQPAGRRLFSMCRGNNS